MTDDPEFYAWLDGELAPDAAARMAAKVAADPALVQVADRHRGLSHRLNRAFDSISAAPVPDSIARAGRSADIIDFAGARRRRLPLPSWGLQAAAMAASLAIGLVVGGSFKGGGPVASDHGQLIASAALGHALDVRLASAPANEGVRILLTFREHSGHYCRTYTDRGASGLACRDGARWRIRGLFQASDGQGGDYRMAAGPDPHLMALVDQAIVGEPLDVRGEKAAIREAWK